MDVSEGREADQALQAGAVDTVLDSPAALDDREMNTVRDPKVSVRA